MAGLFFKPMNIFTEDNNCFLKRKYDMSSLKSVQEAWTDFEGEEKEELKRASGEIC